MGLSSLLSAALLALILAVPGQELMSGSNRQLELTLANAYNMERQRAFDSHCQSRRQLLVEGEEPPEWPRTVTFPVLFPPSSSSCRSYFGVEIPWKIAFESRGFSFVNDSAIASFVISKQWSIESIGFRNTCPDTQIVNQIGGMGDSFSNKRGMLQNLLAFEALQEDPTFKAATFSPPTYAISEANQCQKWLEQVAAEPDASWLLKDADKDNQQGIHLMSQSKLEGFQREYANTGKCTDDWQMLAQYLIDPPLLIDGHKFDMRVYVLVASTDPMMVFLHPMFLVRRSHLPHSREQIFTQMGPDWKKDGHNQMSPLALAKWLGWSSTHLASFYKRVKVMVSQFSGLLRSKLTRGHGAFTMLGLDIIAAADETLWLLEVNSSPEMSQPGRHPWRLAFQEELLKEVVDIQLAVVAARRASYRQKCHGSSCKGVGGVDVAAEVLVAVRRFEAVYLEQSDGSFWRYHLDGNSTQEASYSARLEYLNTLHTQYKDDPDMKVISR